MWCPLAVPAPPCRKGAHKTLGVGAFRVLERTEAACPFLPQLVFLLDTRRISRVWNLKSLDASESFLYGPLFLALRVLCIVDLADQSSKIEKMRQHPLGSMCKGFQTSSCSSSAVLSPSTSCMFPPCNATDMRIERVGNRVDFGLRHKIAVYALAPTPPHPPPKGKMAAGGAGSEQR